MNRLEALKLLQEGGTLITQFTPEKHGVASELEVRIQIALGPCNFSERRVREHFQIGPIHLRFWEAGNPHWLHITTEQLHSFIERNYPEE